MAHGGGHSAKEKAGQGGIDVLKEGGSPEAAALAAALGFIQGGNTTNGEDTFKFLHQHLYWPEPGK